ncbi:MAG: TetR family transcriptional regulator [Sphingomonas sp.]|nr:TetR family transcriptional regulator [Sphingomonas sp.]|tara:strand:- start:115 stop:729 length:615 start_codon:yes stop_codon:yes gene_type:complete
MAETAPRRKRRKRSAAEAREEALAAARVLLIEGGPGAVTLANVGRAIAMSHTNVIHHFGSASGLQAALMAYMVRDLADALSDAVSGLHTDAQAPSRLVDRVFDAFGEGGAGQLAAWLALAREFDQFDGLKDAVRDLVAAVRDSAGNEAGSDERIRGLVLLIAVCAFGDAVIGPHLRPMLDQDDKALRRLVTQLLPILISPRPGS